MKKKRKKHLKSVPPSSPQSSNPVVSESVLPVRQIPVAPSSVETVVPKAPAKKPDEIIKSLSAIYEGRPSKEWMNTMDRGRRKMWIAVSLSIVALVAFAVTAAWIGFLWWGSRGFNGKGIQIQIEGPDKISIGQEVTYYVNWFNIAREPLAATEFRISFPNDFMASNIEPKPTSDPMVFRLGSQPVEGRGTVKITGMFTGSLGTKSAIQVISMYRPASFNSDFETLDTREIEYAQSVLEGSLSLPSKVIPGDPVSFAYQIKNTSSKTMENLRARFLLPEGFAPVSADSEDSPDVRERFFDLGSLEQGATTSVSIGGSFTVRSGGDTAIVAEAGFALPDGSFAPAQRSEGTISVLAGDLDLELVVNGNQGDRSADLGEWQRLALSYENLSGEDLSDISLIVHLDPVLPEGAPSVHGLIDWKKIDDDLEGIISGETVTFTKKELEDLKEIGPDESGMIEFSVPIAAAIAKEQDVPISMFAEAKIGSVGGDKVGRIVKTQPITLKIRSDASVSASARYTSEEGAPVGSGPLPPVAGSSTVYRVEWNLSKTLHGLERITVTASLPPSVSWVAEREVGAGSIVVDQDKKLVTWTINAMPEDVNSLFASFDVSLRPSEADIGRFAQLLGETRFECTDAKLSESILRTDGALNTDLPDDPIAKRKGVVSR